MDNATSSEAPLAGMETRLRAYGVVDGIRTLKDSQVGMLFRQSKEDGVLQWVMYSQDTTTMTESSFIEYFKNENRLLFLVYHADRLAGWFWLDDLGHRTARIHFAPFRWTTREKLTVRVAKEALWLLLCMKFKRGASLQVIRGESPTFNKGAVRFMQKLGLKVIGEMPHAAFDYRTQTTSSMLYSYITKDMLKNDVLSYYRREGTCNELETSKLLALGSAS
jgi:hypothetical protein